MASLSLKKHGTCQNCSINVMCFKLHLIHFIIKSIFSKYGWPDTLVTDNGPCYTSKEFQLLMQSMSVSHLTSSPHYPQSNGLAEKFVGIVKNLFHKAKEGSQSPYTALMVYRNTPLNGTLQPPMQILQGRQACTDLPLLHAAKVQMGISHAPQPTDEILCVKNKSLSSPHMIYPLVRMSCTGNPMIKDGIPQLSSNSDQRRDHTSSKQMTMSYRKTQVHLKPYTPEKKIEPPELYKEDCNHSVHNNQSVNNNQRP